VQRAGQQRSALVPGDDLDGEVARVVAAGGLELPLRPVDGGCHELGGQAEAVGALGEFLAERAVRATVSGDQLALPGERTEQRLEPLARRFMGGLDSREHRAGLGQVSLDHGLDEVVLGLEVVVDVAERHLRDRTASAAWSWPRPARNGNSR
jgi:hypothetical protein